MFGGLSAEYLRRLKPIILIVAIDIAQVDLSGKVLRKNWCWWVIISS
jgi:hypothetical protein